MRLDREFDPELHEDLVQRLKLQLGQVFKWRWEWEVENPRATREEGGDSEARGATQFASISQAVEITTYNAVLIWLLGLLWKLDPLNTPHTISSTASHPHPPQPSPDTATTPLHLPGSATQLRTVAIEICLAFDFQIRNIGEKNNNDHVSALFFLMPIGLAWSVLERDANWKTFISEALASSFVTRGYETGQNVFGFGAYAVPIVEDAMK